MTESRIALDTNAVIYLTTKGNIIPSVLQSELDAADLFVSVISEIELFAKKGMPPDEEKNLRVLLSDRIDVIDLTNAVKKETVALRRNNGLKLPDCIVAATAIVLRAELLTADAKLLRLTWPGYKTKNLKAQRENVTIINADEEDLTRRRGRSLGAKAQGREK
jgi:predicted nucleic acid-binding protein